MSNGRRLIKSVTGAPPDKRNGTPIDVAAEEVMHEVARQLPVSIEQHLMMVGLIKTVLEPIFKQVALNTKYRCVDAVLHVPDYAGLLYKEPQHMHQAIEQAVRRVRC